ncbi:MAG: biotin transporter BioY [Lysobacteraceae bacterium]|nr:MAG: biotin transporter BioY [Xanthomonadaceae bacterium]
MSPGHIAPLRAVLADRPVAWGIAAVLAGSLLIAAGSWISTPMYPVPMTLQTLAVLMVAGLAGARLAAASVITWLALAAIGLPLLADGAGGLEPFSGPTAGYLAGMVIAAIVCGWLTEKPAMRGWIAMLLVFLAGHALILSSGWLRLAALTGPQAAWDSGVAPFITGAVLKSTLAVVVVKLADPRVRSAATVD